MAWSLEGLSSSGSEIDAYSSSDKVCYKFDESPANFIIIAKATRLSFVPLIPPILL